MLLSCMFPILRQDITANPTYLAIHLETAIGKTGQVLGCFRRQRYNSIEYRNGFLQKDLQE